MCDACTYHYTHHDDHLKIDYPMNSCGSHLYSSARNENKCGGKRYDPMDPALMVVGDSKENCCPPNDPAPLWILWFSEYPKNSCGWNFGRGGSMKCFGEAYDHEDP